MRVLAFNGSPKMDKGNTAIILNPFLKGMRDAGADVELFYTKNLKINPCQGEFNCWLKTPGECFQKDDMQMLYPKLGADVMVFASPLYLDGMSGPMKNLIDRMISIVQPFIELRDGHCRHPMREDTGIEQRKVVLISSCGFWELNNFDPLVFHVKAICQNLNREFVGALLRPHIRGFKSMLDMGAPVRDVLEAAEEAGHQLVKDGKMSEKTLGIVGRQLLPLEAFVEMVNQGFKEMVEAGEKK